MSNLLERSLGPRVMLRLDLPEGLPSARIDANQLELAILNLAINARDAMARRRFDRHPPFRIPGEERSGAEGRALSETVYHRYRHRHEPGNTEEGDRAVLLVKAARQGHRPRAVDGTWARRATRAARCNSRARSERVRRPRWCCRYRPWRRKAEAPAPTAQKVRRSAVILFVDDDPLIAMSTTEMLEDLGPPCDRRQFRPARARYPAERAADRT